MATQIITRQLCDFCQADDLETADAERLTISLNGTTWEIDACKRHGEPLHQLADTLAELGRKVPSTKRTARADGTETDERVPCPMCGKSLKNRSSLTSHMRQMHETTLSEHEGEAADFPCPDCERHFTTPQGVAVHHSRTHGN